MPGLVPKVHGIKRAYFKLKRGITMNANLAGPIEGVLSRSEMKQIMAGDPQAPGEGSVYVICKNCQNSSCQGTADDCETGAYQICGPGEAESPGPAPYDCTYVMEA